MILSLTLSALIGAALQVKAEDQPPAAKSLNASPKPITPDKTSAKLFPEAKKKPVTIIQNPKQKDIATKNQPKKEQTTEEKADSELKPLTLEGEPKEEKPSQELSSITKKSKNKANENIDVLNFVQPSVSVSPEEQATVDMILSRAEQEQLILLWRSTLERNKTIRFIVQKLTPEGNGKKKNQALSQILNTAIFLPLYALQSVAPADVTSMASILGAGVASDLINGHNSRNADKMVLSQTEMVIMFMMIDQVAERVRESFRTFKQEKVDAALVQDEFESARQEAAASLDLTSPESRFLTQIRLRQLEREMRRINIRLRSSRITLIDLAGPEPVSMVEAKIDQEVQAIINTPSVIEVKSRR